MLGGVPLGGNNALEKSWELERLTGRHTGNRLDEQGIPTGFSVKVA